MHTTLDIQYPIELPGAVTAYRVSVQDHERGVLLALPCEQARTAVANLKPEEARYLALLLQQAATRAEASNG